MLRRRLFLAGLPVVLLPKVAAARSATAAGEVNVLYAGSLVSLMERGLRPAFDRAGRARFRGYPGGSVALAREIAARLIPADVFISASPKVNDLLMGPEKGNRVAWYMTFARSPLVIGYDPASRYAADLRAKPWYLALQEPGIRIGRTDPKLDPKGRLTIALVEKTAALHQIPDLARKILGPPENPAQVFPEQELVGRLQSGQIDAGFFYSTETTELHIAAIQLPEASGIGAEYTATVLNHAPHAAAAVDFLAFLLGPQGASLMQRHGLDLVPPRISGDVRHVPPRLRALCTRAD